MADGRDGGGVSQVPAAAGIGVVDGLPGGGPPCAICVRTGGEARRVVYLTHGVAVWLCDTHAADRFLRQDEGTVFADRLAGMWRAAGCLTIRRAAALRTHVRQTRSAGMAAGWPGSYSWPVLRREAERRFAAGHDPRDVIRQLRARHADCPAIVPSARTMRRWHTQARWLTPPTPHTREARSARRRRVPAMFALIPDAMTQHPPWSHEPRWRGT